MAHFDIHRCGPAASSSRRGRIWNLLVVVAVVLVTINIAFPPPQVQASPGDLDAAFGSGGRVTTAFGGPAGASAIAIQRDGRIVAAGSAFTFTRPRFALARYDRDGSLDAGFATGGTVITDLGGEGALLRAVSVDRVGRIVAVGVVSTSDTRQDFAVVRYTRAGKLDTSFGSDGIVTTRFDGWDSEARDVAVDPRGGIVVAGVARRGARSADFALARYRSDGSLDPTFGTAGTALTDIDGGTDAAGTIDLRPDGRIVVAGSGVTAGDTRMTVARYEPDGTLDVTFGSGGLVSTGFGGSASVATSVVARPDGSVVAAGGTFAGRDLDLALARFRRDGSLDTRFGDDGKIITDLGGRELASAVDARPDGSVVAASTPPSGGFAIVSYRRDGRLDEAFGTGGVALADFGGSLEGVAAVAIQPDRKVVAAGHALLDDFQFALARFAAR